MLLRRGSQSPAGLARPMFTDVLKIKRCVIVTGQGDTKDFSKDGHTWRGQATRWNIIQP